jgi:hypothetical protein
MEQEARDEHEQGSRSDSDSALENEEAEAAAGENARRTVSAAEEQLPMTGEELLQYVAHLRAQLAHIKPTLMQTGAPPQAEAGTEASGANRSSFLRPPTLAHAASRRLFAQAEVSAGAAPPPMLSAERACAALQRSAPVYLARQSALLLQQQPQQQPPPQQQQ